MAHSFGACAGDDVRVHEDAGADDAAHHDHGYVEEVELAGEGHGGIQYNRTMLSRRQLLSLLPASVLAQTPYGAPYNYDEAKAGPYKLPEVLTVHDTRAWDARRRPELLRLFEMHVYGRTPRNHLVPFMQLLAPDEEVFEGKATRRQVRIFFSEEKRGPKMDLLLYVPTGAKKPVPAFLGLNFGGNQTVRARSWGLRKGRRRRAGQRRRSGKWRS